VADVPIYRRDFKQLAELRAEEARVLLARGKQQGAYYLSGYAVECALKACIAKRTKRFEFPPKKTFVEKAYSHNLNELARLAGLEDELNRNIKNNQSFAANWSTVKDWTEQSRYTPSGLNGKDMYHAVVDTDGVLPWIKLRW
jgi:HEPN domain-containing protein